MAAASRRARRRSWSCTTAASRRRWPTSPRWPRRTACPVVEDAAHALGARYGGAPIGSHSRFVMFSLQAIKHMTTVDGGMLALQRAEDDAERARLFRWFGIDREAPRTEVDVRAVGFKYHMNNVTATIGLVALEHVRRPHRAPHRQRPLLRCGARGRRRDRAVRVGPRRPSRLLALHGAAPSAATTSRAHLDRTRASPRSTVHRRNDEHTVFAAEPPPAARARRVRGADAAHPVRLVGRATRTASASPPRSAPGGERVARRSRCTCVRMPAGVRAPPDAGAAVRLRGRRGAGARVRGRAPRRGRATRRSSPRATTPAPSRSRWAPSASARATRSSPRRTRAWGPTCRCCSASRGPSGATWTRRPATSTRATSRRA